MPQLLFCSSIWRSYIHFGFPFKVAVVDNYFSYRSNSQQFVNVWLFSFFSISILSCLFIFIGRWFFGWVSSVLKFSMPNLSFLVHRHCRQISLSIVRKNNYLQTSLIPNRCTNQPSNRVYSQFLCACKWYRMLYCISTSVSLNCYYRLSICLVTLIRVK